MPYQLTPEQIALQEERKRKKEAAKAAVPDDPHVPTNEDALDKILERDWVKTRAPRTLSSSVKVMTWNVRDYSRPAMRCMYSDTL